MIERAELGVDGDHAFALLGDDILSGEAEFVKVDSTEPQWTSACRAAERRAATKAYDALRARLGRQFSYWIGPSHPDHV